MKTSFLHWSAIALVIGLFAALSSGCAVVPEGYGYGYDSGVGIGFDYYEPFGADYGGWAPGYRVAPFRGGDHRPQQAGNPARQHAYRGAPAAHAMPSIPSRSRSGGARSH